MDVAKYKIDRGIKIARSHIVPNPWNPNELDARTNEALDESLEDYGQIYAILVRPLGDRYQIIDGYHRFIKIKAQEIYCDIIYKLGDNDAKKLTIQLNETRGKAEPGKLAKLINDLRTKMNESELRRGLPFDEAHFADLRSRAEELRKGFKP
ncbi:MAG: ParB N-terminal domain-containing protein, partial [Okeania sp. SIO2D1]|nr:ParB N-terminal domain-containing protein [Okeania sp. SIO2D1]